MALILDDCDIEQRATWKGFVSTLNEGEMLKVTLAVIPDEDNPADRRQDWTGSMTIYASDLHPNELQRIPESYRQALMRRARTAIGPGSYCSELGYGNQDA